MATAWSQLGPAIRTRIIAQQTGSPVPAVYLDYAPLAAPLPYVLIVGVTEEELQVFDDDAETTEIEVDVSIYSDKFNGNAPGATHLSYVNMTKNAIRRWKPTLVNWDVDALRFDSARNMEPLEDALQTVLSLTAVLERK
jgi:hypothetical protein